MWPEPYMSIKWYDIMYTVICPRINVKNFYLQVFEPHTHLCSSFVDSNTHSHFNKSSRTTNQYHRMLLCDNNFKRTAVELKWIVLVRLNVDATIDRFLWVLYSWGMEYYSMFFFWPSKETKNEAYFICCHNVMWILWDCDTVFYESRLNNGHRPLCSNKR